MIFTNFNLANLPKPFTQGTLVCMFLFLLLSSCSNTDKKKDTPDMKVPATVTDTFYLGDRLVHVTRTSEAEFNKVKQARTSIDSTGKYKLVSDSSLISKSGDTLLFRTGNGFTKLLNNLSDDDAYAAYQYKGFLPELKQFLVMGSYYEWFSYLLIDAETGDTSIIYSEPILSPAKKYFVSSNSDLLGGMNYNGMILYENTHKPKLVGERELSNWGPDEIRWLDENTMFIKGVELNAEGNNEQTVYFKLRLE